MNERSRAWASALALFAVSAVSVPALTLAGGGHDRDDDHGFRIETLSTKPQLVTGGDVLVRVDVPRGLPLRLTRIEVNGRNVTGAFHPDRDGSLLGVITGLKNGRNVIEASA